MQMEYTESVEVSTEVYRAAESLGDEFGMTTDEVISEVFFRGMEAFKTEKARERVYGPQEAIPDE